jgi:CDGSH iron-sulfur domain-containing protein 3
MDDVKIQALDNGPFLVKGETTIIDGLGNIIATNDQCYLCRCGLSSTQPYCSGAHHGKYHNELRS